MQWIGFPVFKVQKGGQIPRVLQGEPLVEVHAGIAPDLVSLVIFHLYYQAEFMRG